MAGRPDDVLLREVASGDVRAFEVAYAQFDGRLRLAAWRICRRGDWIDDLVNETWRRAFEARQTYDAGRPLLVWLTGILRNVVREQRRKWAGEGAGGAEPPEEDSIDPAQVAAEAEVLAVLNESVSRLPEEERDIVRWRFFEGQSLRAVAQRVAIPEATLREVRLPAICERLRSELLARGLIISEVFAAQTGQIFQFIHRERE